MAEPIKTLVVTGYRSYEMGVFKEDDPKITVIKNVLKQRLKDYLEEGLEWVLIGGNLGVEIWAAQAAFELREEYPEFRVGVIFPFLEYGNQWKENNNSYINITIYNKNSKYKTVDLRKILYKIDDKNLVLNECYSYYKGKSDGNIIGELNDEGILRSSNLIKISNGYTGIANLNADEKINFAEIKYDTGSYIIIATPIIFTTY